MRTSFGVVDGESKRRNRAEMMEVFEKLVT